MRSLLVAVSISLCVPAIAQTHWVRVAQTADREDTYYIQAGSVHDVGSFRRAWTLLDTTVPDSTGFSSLIVLQEFDCKARQSRYLQITGYYGRMGSGTAKTGPMDPSDWAYAAPGTIDDSIVSRVCSL
jgi:hypothetical protein